MADIINLRQARKRKARAERETEAGQNRRTHGEAKSATALRKRRADKAAADLDAHRRDNAGTEPPKT